MDWEYTLTILPSILDGFLLTITFWFVVLVSSLILSIALVILYDYQNKYVNFVINVFTSFVRGTPLLFQIYFIYFGLAIIFSLKLTNINSAYLAFILSWTAYLTETIKGSVNSVEDGQRDAAKVLGLSRFQTIIYVVLPQALISAFPSITNQAVSLVYGTALLSVLGLNDMLRAAQIGVVRDFRLEGYAIAGILYIIFNGLIILSFKRTGNLLSKFKK